MALCRQLTLSHHFCIMAGVYYFGEGEEVNEGVQQILFCPNLKIAEAYFDFAAYTKTFPNNINNKLHYILHHPIRAARLGLSHQDTFKKDYGKYIASIAERYNVDAIICVQDPIWAVQQVMAAVQKNLNRIFAVYQVDPWGLFDNDNVNGQIREQRDELAALQQSTLWFTTPVLYDLYAKHPMYQPFLTKMTSMEFPNLVYRNVQEDSVFVFDRNYVNLLFCGSIQGDYRDPGFLLKLLELSAKSGIKLRCYFLGDILKEFFLPYAEKLRGMLFFHSAVAPERGYATMQQADCLVNIGNSYTNMVPSKIIDYFAMCKPILNIQKIYRCPSERYFNLYPLVQTVKEFEPLDKQVPQAINFLQQCKSMYIKYETVERLFINSTPQKAASILENKLLQHYNSANIKRDKK